MRSVSVRLCDLEKVTIPLGFVGENIFTKVYIDCKKVFDEHPDAVPALSVIPPQGGAYPAVVTKESDMVIWEITASDLIYKGSGEIQLSFIQDEMVGKTWTAKTKVYKSIEPSGEVPEPIQNWLDQANATLALIPEMVDEAIGDHLAELIIDDTAGAGVTDKTWSADKSTTELNSKANIANPVFTGTDFSFNRKPGTEQGYGGSATFGWRCEASGNSSFAEGNNTSAKGNYSHSEGLNTSAQKIASHAEGQGAWATGESSHAENYFTLASGNYSHAEGYYTESKGNYQHVSGKANVVDNENKYAEIVGNGTLVDRSNARALDWEGNERIAGDLYVGCNPDSTGGTKVATINDLPTIATTAETQEIITEYGVSA